MEKLRLFAVSSVTEPPVELHRKGASHSLRSTLTLPLSPQLLIFNQGEWPSGGDKDVALDVYIDSENIGQMDKDTKCFTWDSSNLKGHTEGDNAQLEVKVIGLKTPEKETKAPAKIKKKSGPKKKLPPSSSPQDRKKEDKKTDPNPLTDISKTINTDSQKNEPSIKTSEKQKKRSPKVEGSALGKEKLKKKGKDIEDGSALVKQKQEKKKKDTLAASGSKTDKKSTPPGAQTMKKTKQTQLNFTGAKKVVSTVGVDVRTKKDAADEAKKTTLSDDVEKKEKKDDKKSERNEEERDGSAKKITETDLTDEGGCFDAQALNEITPQTVDVPSPLPRKPAKKKRRRDDNAENSNGPTPQKRGTRMRALATEGGGTPKGSRGKAGGGLVVSPFKEKNALTPGAAQSEGKSVLHSDGRMTTCVDLSARVPRPSARWGHTMLLSRPRCAMLIGGQGDRQQLSKDSVWSLNTDTRKWQCQDVQSEGQKPENRMGHTATYDPTLRCIYIFGGSKNARWFHDIHMYDLDENRWTLTKVNGKAPTRAYHTANLHRHELWIFGGVYPRPDPTPDGCSNDIHIFSPVMQNWYCPIVQGEKPTPRSGHSATLIQDQLVMFGGWDAPFCYNDLFILDLTTVDWSQPDVKGTPPKPRSWHASCALTNKRILIHGGYDGNNALEDTFIFDLAARSWSCLVVPNSPKPRAGHAAVCVPYRQENQEEDEVLVFGGGDNDGEFYNDLVALSIPLQPVVELE